MKIITSSLIRATVQDLYKISDQSHWEEKLKDTYGLKLIMAQGVHEQQWITRQICNIFKDVPPALIKACGINKLIIRNDMGPNKSYYPNHGYFINDQVALNADIFYHPDQPDDFFDFRGYFLTRPQQTLLHEFGHGFDAYHDDLSLKPKWMALSGWSKERKQGLKRLEIKEKDAPEVIGEYYYDPKYEFTRFYAKRNPYDDFADSFSFYIAGMKDKVPANKVAYLDALLKKYF